MRECILEFPCNEFFLNEKPFKATGVCLCVCITYTYVHIHTYIPLVVVLADSCIAA
jgi:hypothetical protein